MDLTAQTATASTVHHPFGSPSGPGLFRVKGLQLPAYIQNVARALERSGSAKSESQAIQMAVGIVTRWSAGDAGHGKRVHPDVQAAASRALAEWEAAKAAAHSHSNRDGDAVDLSSDLGEAMAVSWNATRPVTVDLARVAPGGGSKTAAASTKGMPTGAQVNIATGAAGPRAKSSGGKKPQSGGGGSSDSLHPHVAAGSPAGGQFAKKGSGGSGSSSAGKTAAPKKAAAKKAGTKAPAAKAGTKAAAPKAAKPAPGKAGQQKAQTRQAALAQRAGLMKQAAGDRAKVKAINAQIASLTTAIHAAVKAAAAQKAAAANKTSATSAAATAVKAAATAPAASTTSTTAAGTTSTTTAASTTATAAKASATVAQMRATRSTLRARVVTLKAHAAGLEKQAAAIKLSSGEDGSGRFLEMAFAEALTERVPPGKAEGGQFHARTSLTRHDTPEEAARAVNAMSEQQRAAIRIRMLPPPGFSWGRGDRLAVAT